MSIWAEPNNSTFLFFGPLLLIFYFQPYNFCAGPTGQIGPTCHVDITIGPTRQKFQKISNNFHKYVPLVRFPFHSIEVIYTINISSRLERMKFIQNNTKYYNTLYATLTNITLCLILQYIICYSC